MDLLGTPEQRIQVPEVLEQIFSHIPMLDLLQIQSLVCKKWKNVIDKPIFMPWKKAYYRFKLESVNVIKLKADIRKIPDKPPPTKKSKIEYEDDSDDTDDEKNHFDNLDTKLRLFYSKIEPFSNEFINMKNHLHPPVVEENESDKFRLETAAPWLINFICDEFEMEGRKGQFKLIRGHRKFAWAQDWLKERMPKLEDQIEIAAVPILCCIAENTWDIKEIFNVLFQPSFNSCSSLVVSEVMYCIALAFLIFNRERSLPLKYHYQVFHAISFFENEFNMVKSNDKGDGNEQETFMLTAEQARIAKHKLVKERKDTIKIVAFAGTGKTTTLIKMCKENPHLKFLVVCYNRTVADYAKKMFPKKNVECTTAHSLAYRKVVKGQNFNKDTKLCENLKAQDVMSSDMMTTGILGAGNFMQRAAQIVDTLESFMNSPDDQIEMDHVPNRWKTKLEHSTGMYPFECDGMQNISPTQRQIVLEDSRGIWKAMKNPVDKRVKLPHDGYLKIFQLERPCLQDNFLHDVLMMDEGQDMNPTILDIFNNQDINKIIVGDPNQQIYAFRGAVNALGSVEATHTYHLTQSFRFGPAIGLVANTCLEQLNSVTSQTLVGGKKQDFLRSRDDLIDIKEFTPIAVIGRTNFGVFKEMVRIACNTSNPPRCAVAGGLRSYQFHKLLQMYYLYTNQRHLMTMYKTFASFAAFKAWADNTNDRELVIKIQIVEEYKEEIPTILDKINERCRYDPENSDYIFTSTHKAKGLEWKTVIILDDFFRKDGNEIGAVPGGIFTRPLKNGLEEFGNDEKNILYVAMTRAKKNLVFNFALLNLLLGNGDTFERVVYMKDKKFDQHVLKCAKCGENIIFEDNSLGLESLPVKCGKFNGAMFRKTNGILCSLCSSSRRFAFLNSEQNIGNIEKKLKNREFLRYFIGALPDKHEDVLAKVNKDEEKFNHPGNGAGITYKNQDLALYFDDVLMAQFDDEFDLEFQ